MGPQFQRLEIDRNIFGSGLFSSLSEVHTKWGESQKFFMMQIRGKILHALNPISMETSEQRKNWRAALRYFFFLLSEKKLQMKLGTHLWIDKIYGHCFQLNYNHFRDFFTIFFAGCNLLVERETKNPTISLIFWRFCFCSSCCLLKFERIMPSNHVHFLKEKNSRHSNDENMIWPILCCYNTYTRVLPKIPANHRFVPL